MVGCGHTLYQSSSNSVVCVEPSDQPCSGASWPRTGEARANQSPANKSGRLRGMRRLAIQAGFVPGRRLNRSRGFSAGDWSTAVQKSRCAMQGGGGGARYGETPVFACRARPGRGEDSAGGRVLRVQTWHQALEDGASDRVLQPEHRVGLAFLRMASRTRPSAFCRAPRKGGGSQAHLLHLFLGVMGWSRGRVP